MGMLTQTLKLPLWNNRKEPNLKHKPNNNNKTTTHNNKTGRNQMITKQEIKNPHGQKDEGQTGNFSGTPGRAPCQYQ